MFKKTILISAVVALITVTAEARGHHGESRGHHNGEDRTHQESRGDVEHQNTQDHKGQSNHDNGNHNSDDRGEHYGDNSMGQGTSMDIASIPLSELTDTQKRDLSFMIEEEKVARDVYSYLYGTWGSKVFNSISNSEQKHINALETILNRYSLDIPSTLNTKGEFENDELQSLYNSLIEKGELSLADALTVGVLVEEKDISDLKSVLDGGVPSDLEVTYQNLLKGSYKHLDAFNRQLGK